MTTPKKITQKEWKFVQSQLEVRGLNRHEIEAVDGVFFDDLHDVDFGEHQPLFGKPIPGVTASEAKEKIEELRNPYSPTSKSLKTPLHPSKLDIVEQVIKEAIEGDKEPLW